MNTKKIILPLVALFLLAGCNSSGGKKTSKASSSQPASKTNQPIPNYPDLPDYGSYSGEPGVGPEVLKTIDISPKGKCYSFVGDSVTIKGKVNGNVTPKVPAEQGVITYTADKPELVTLEPVENSNNVNVTFNAVGDVTITAHSYEDRFKRTVTYHVNPNDGSVDYYQPETDSSGSIKDAEKAKFGWAKTDDDETKKGNAEGDAQLGLHSWHYKRELLGTVGGYGGGFSFGRGDKEGKMTFSTTFTKSIKIVVIQCSSATAKDPVTGSSLDHGCSTFDAWFGSEDHLERIVGSTSYPAGTECFTEKFSNEENTSYHTVNCEGKTGSFSFEIGESTGAIYLKSILIEYAE